MKQSVHLTLIVPTLTAHTNVVAKRATLVTELTALISTSVNLKLIMIAMKMLNAKIRWVGTHVNAKRASKEMARYVMILTNALMSLYTLVNQTPSASTSLVPTVAPVNLVSTNRAKTVLILMSA